jgi:anti-sigma-K factor RskA
MRGQTRTAPWLALAAAVVLTAGIAIYAVQLHRQVANLQGRLDAAQSATAVLAAPDLARIDLQGQTVAPDARARALWSRSRGLVFSAANLPALPAGKVYQVWVVTAQAPVSAGLLVPDQSGGGTAYYMTPPDIAAPVAVAVTLEPAGGVPAPTGDKYLVGTPAATGL